MENVDFTSIEYRPNENALRVRVHHLRDVWFHANDGTFELVQLKRTTGGILYQETELILEMPNYAIPAGLTLTSRKFAAHVAAPIIGTIGRALHLH